MPRDVYTKNWINRGEGLRAESQDLHHICPTSRFWADIEQNKVQLYHSLHAARHKVFSNGTIDENLRQLMNISKKALSIEFQNDIAKILQETDKRYFYKNWVYLPNKKPLDF